MSAQPQSRVPLEDVPDEALLHSVRSGDVSAFDTLYQRHRRSAYVTASRAGARGHDAEDVVADAFVRVLRAVSHGRGPTDSFAGYLTTAVRRVAWSNNDYRARFVVTDDLEDLDDEWHDSSPAAIVDSAIGKALMSLPSDWRELLWRIEVLGEKAADIAAERGCSPNAVSAAASRARRRLRSAMPDSTEAEVRSA